MEGSGDQEKITVFFQKAGNKKLVAKYANLELVFGRLGGQHHAGTQRRVLDPAALRWRPARPAGALRDRRVSCATPGAQMPA